MSYRTRIELYCGMNETIPKRLRQYRRAEKVAKHYGVPTYFDEHEEHGNRFVDGYLYPCSGDLEEVLKELDRAGVEYDNIDLPERLAGSHLHKKLKERYRQGVSINPGDIREETCRG